MLIKEKRRIEKFRRICLKGGEEMNEKQKNSDKPRANRLTESTFDEVEFQFCQVINRLDNIDNRLKKINQKFDDHTTKLHNFEMNMDRHFHSLNEGLIARIERNNRQQWDWNITILIATVTLVLTMAH